MRLTRGVAWLALAALAGAAASPPALAQSGRRRERPQPPAQPKPAPPARPGAEAPPVAEPPPAAPVPPGGIVAEQATAGALNRYVLRNGVTLIVHENPATQLAAVRVEIRTGPEASAGAGLATARAAALAPRPAGSLVAQVRALGGEVEVSASAQAVAFAAVVPAQAAMQAVDATTALLETGYRPDRTTLVVVGNVISYSVLEQVQRTFGGYVAPAAGAVQAPPAPMPPPPGAPAPSGYATSRGGAGAAVVSVEYPAPGLAAADAAAVDLLATALAGGRASRLARALRWPALAAEVSGAYEGHADEGRIGFELVVDPKRLDAAEAAFFREVERFRRERVSAAELQRARNVYERRFHAARETVEGEARVLAGFESAHGDVRAAARHLERVRAVTAADLQTAAARVLVASRAGVREVLPPEAPERTFTAKTYAETIAAWAPGAGRDVAPAEVRDAEPAAAVPEGRERRRAGETDDVVVVPVPVPIRDFSTLNGPKAIVREDQSRPLLSIGLFYPAGRVAEPAAERGITELMLRSMLRGSRKYPGDRLAFALEQIGAEARVVNEADFFGIVLEVLSRNADQAMEIAIDLVEQPVFDKEEIARERELLLVDQRRSGGVARAVELFWQSRYAAHAYGVPALGLPETVGRLTDEQVKAWSTRAARSQLPLVAIVGDTDGSSLVSRHVAEGFDRRDGEPPASPGLPAPAPAGEAADSRGTATAQAIGYPTPGGAWAGFDALEVAAAGAAARAQGDLDDAGARVEAVVERRRLGGAALVTAVSAPGDETRARARVEARLAEAGGSDFAAAGARAAVSRLRREQPFTVLLVEYVRAAAFGAPLETVETAGERLRGVSADAARKVAAAVFNPGIVGRGVSRGRG